MDELKDLRSTNQSNRHRPREVNKREQARRRQVSGLIWDWVSTREKGEVYNVLVRTAVMYGLETVAYPRIQKAEQ